MWFKSFGTSDSQKKVLSLTTIDVLLITSIVHVNTKPNSENDPPFNRDESTCVLYEPPLSISFFNQPSQTVVLYRFQFKMSIEVIFFPPINLFLFFLSFLKN